MTWGRLIRHVLETIIIVPHPIMELCDLLVINGLVVTASDVGHYDIAIRHEKIALLAPQGSLTGIAAMRVIDAQGGIVMVG